MNMKESVYQEAKKRVKKKKKFRNDLSSFIIWGGAMLFINIFITRGYMWSLWVIFFWGLGVLKQAFDVYGFPFSNSDDWEEEEIQKEMKRIKRLGDGSEKNVFEDEGKNEEVLMEQEESGSRKSKWDEDELV